MAETDVELPAPLHFAPGGRIVESVGYTVTKFDLFEISIVAFPADLHTTIKKI